MFGGRGGQKQMMMSSLVQTDGWEEMKGRGGHALLLQDQSGPAQLVARLLSPGVDVSPAKSPVDAATAATKQRQQEAARAEAAAAAVAAAAARTGRGAGKGQRAVAMEESVEIWYGGKIYSLVIPEEAMVAVADVAARRNGVKNAGGREERLSSVADR